MGVSTSKVEKAFGNGFPENERIYGLENFGNTCYCNSVLQALYYCPPFRQRLQAHAYAHRARGTAEEESVLTCLGELFTTISSQKKKVGVIPPRRLIGQLRKENELFRGYMQQDAHEFLNYLLNTVAESLAAEQSRSLGSASARSSTTLRPTFSQRLFSKRWNGARTANQSTDTVQNNDVMSHDFQRTNQAGKDTERTIKTWVQDIFEGVLTNETRCLSCETVSSKDECFLDLSVDIEPETSITHCLKNFSGTEYLRGEHKYFCNTCCSLQEAQKSMRIKRLPPILALHLKRFNYIEELQRYQKLSYRVRFSLELKLFNTSADAENPDQMYDLFAVIIHRGSGPSHGHYVSIVKSYEHWLVFDDDTVEMLDESVLTSVSDSKKDTTHMTESGYILFYQARGSATLPHQQLGSAASKEKANGSANGTGLSTCVV